MTEKARVFVYYFNNFQIIFYEFSKPKDLFKVRNGRGLWEGQHYKQHEYQLTRGLRRIEVLTHTHTHRTEWCVWVYAYSFVGLSQLKQRHFLFTAARERAVCSINNVKAGEEITNCRLPAAILLSDASINRNNA